MRRFCVAWLAVSVMGIAGCPRSVQVDLCTFSLTGIDSFAVRSLEGTQNIARQGPTVLTFRSSNQSIEVLALDQGGNTLARDIVSLEGNPCACLSPAECANADCFFDGACHLTTPASSDLGPDLNRPNMLSFSVVADSSPTQFLADQPQGALNYLTLSNVDLFRTYLTFVVAGSMGRPVASAKLRLYAYELANGGCDANAFQTSVFDEATLTWNNQPAPILPALGSFSARTVDVWTEVDVTPTVQGDGMVHFVLISDGPGTCNLWSREHGTNVPTLDVTLL